MPDVVLFLEAFTPRFMCPECLAAALRRDEAAVASEIDRHIVTGAVEATHGPCLNCQRPGMVVRARMLRSFAG
jgi:hypothetical protein